MNTINTIKDIDTLISQYQTTNDKNKKKQLKEFIVLNCLPIVKTIAHSIARRSTDPVEDIIQIGCIGLVKAIDLYKPIYNKHFEAYAKIFIAGEIKHYLRDNAELIKSSRAMRELSYKINKIINELTEKLGHEPSDEEIAEALQIMPAQVKECVEQNRRTTFVSIDNNDSNEDCTYSLAEKIEDESAKRTILSYENKMLLDDIITDFMPKSMAKLVLEKSNIDIEKRCHQIQKEERKIIEKILTEFQITVVAPIMEEEIVASGGISLKEINAKTMMSKVAENLFFCGEVIDVDGFCGGFNLQNCWSTGYIAGMNL